MYGSYFLYSFNFKLLPKIDSADMVGIFADVAISFSIERDIRGCKQSSKSAGEQAKASPTEEEDEAYSYSDIQQKWICEDRQSSD
jgi:hypothetical protein